jgi:hypothetical protein
MGKEVNCICHSQHGSGGIGGSGGSGGRRHGLGGSGSSSGEVDETTHVEDGVDDGHVQRHEQHNWLLEKQFPRLLHLVGKQALGGNLGLSSVRLGNVHFSSELGEASSTLAKENRCVGLGGKDGSDDSEQRSKAGDHRGDLGNVSGCGLRVCGAQDQGEGSD